MYEHAEFARVAVGCGWYLLAVCLCFFPVHFPAR